MDSVDSKPPVFPFGNVTDPASSRWYGVLSNYWKECSTRLVYNKPNEICCVSHSSSLVYHDFLLHSRRVLKGLWGLIYAAHSLEWITAQGLYMREVLAPGVEPEYWSVAEQQRLPTEPIVVSGRSSSYHLEGHAIDIRSLRT